MIVLKDFLMGICGASTATSVGLGIYYGIKHGSKNEENNEKIDTNNGYSETEKGEQEEEKENEESEDGSDSSSSRSQPPITETPGSENETLVVKK